MYIFKRVNNSNNSWEPKKDSCETKKIQKINRKKQCARIHPVSVSIPSVVNSDSIRDLQVQLRQPVLGNLKCGSWAKSFNKI